MTLSTDTQELVWLIKLLSDSILMPEGPMEDNQGAIAIVENPIAHARTKHIDIRYHYFCAAVNDGTFKLFYYPKDDMITVYMHK